MKTNKKHNFCAGPCLLPSTVFQQAAAAIEDFNASGLSILEISHRSDAFQEILYEARRLVLELMGLDDTYEALFLHGGASLQFSMLPYNLCSPNDMPAYIDTGRWAHLAYKGAEQLCKPIISASSRAENYAFIPKEFSIQEESPYLHITTNNTIYGTQYKEYPHTCVPLVADMSSDILSKERDYTLFDVIYAGAQKNLGTAGVTLTVIKKERLEKSNPQRVIPNYLDYRQHIAKENTYNTPPVYAIYIAYLNLLWLKEQGLSHIFEQNQKKADLLYHTIDAHPLFTGLAAKEDRSQMNITFDLINPEHKETFDKICKEAGIMGLNGHRTLGGYRASIYNAMPLESVQVLADCINELT